VTAQVRYSVVFKNKAPDWRSGSSFLRRIFANVNVLEITIVNRSIDPATDNRDVLRQYATIL